MDWKKEEAPAKESEDQETRQVVDPRNCLKKGGNRVSRRVQDWVCQEKENEKMIVT